MPKMRLCLNMIVKNEIANLERCLRSVSPWLSHWVIADTGSTDGTQDFIRKFFGAAGIPGLLVETAFISFEQARNTALDAARATEFDYDYVLLCDADMQLVVADPCVFDDLVAPGYALAQRNAIQYWNTRLVRRSAPSRYRGVTHEYLDLEGGGVDRLDGAFFLDHASGSNRIGKFERDIQLLLDGISAEPEMRRYHFYLAQSYRDAGRFEEAALTYAHRVTLGGWDEEIWYAKWQQAKCLLRLGRDADFVANALAAYELRPQRVEPLWDLAHYYRMRGMNHAGAMVCEAGLNTPYPTADALFVADDVYNGALKEEFSIVAFYSRDGGQKLRGARACGELALSRAGPSERRDTARRNLAFYARPLDEIVSGLTAKRIAAPVDSGWVAMNPSVASWRGRLCAIQPAVNHESRGGSYHTPPNTPVITRNYLATFDEALDVRTWDEILPPADLPTPAYGGVLGFEDMRLVVRGDEFWCSSTVRQMNSEGWWEHVLARIDIGRGVSCALTNQRRLPSPNPPRHEKNWTPHVVGDEIRFIYSYHDSVVVSDTGQEVGRRPSSLAVDNLRGGSQAIPFEGGWLAVCHEIAVSGQRRHCLHRFAWFDRATALSRLSEPFKMSGEDIEFVAGLAPHTDGKSLVVSYGVADREAWLAVVPCAEICRLLGLTTGDVPMP